jgi:hypothetical protein
MDYALDVIHRCVRTSPLLCGSVQQDIDEIGRDLIPHLNDENSIAEGALMTQEAPVPLLPIHEMRVLSFMVRELNFHFGGRTLVMTVTAL